MKINKYALVGGVSIAVIVTALYNFAKFKKELKLGLNVLKLDQEGKNTSVLIDNLSHDKIPGVFTIEKLELINDTKELASNVSNANKAIVKNASDPLSFNVLSDTSISEIENAKIAVSFNVLGFKQRILYQPQTVEEVAAETYGKTAAKELDTDSNCCCS